MSRLRLGVVSCSNYPFGYFNAYAALAARADLDAVVHLGDYIYEYANGDFGDGTAVRPRPAPDKEIVTLADYRQRHAQYKADPDSQEVHRQHPFIVVWDDHELTNNTWWGGAENHNPDQGEGDWYVRRERRRAGVLRVDADSRGRAGAQPAHLPDAAVRRPGRSDPARHAAGRPRRAGAGAR